VASHAQKYFLRQSSLTHKKRRSSLFDVVRYVPSVRRHGRSTQDVLYQPALACACLIREPLPFQVENAERAATSSIKGMERLRLKDAITTATATGSAEPGTGTTAQLPPALSLGVGRPPARPDHAALPPSSLLSLQLPRCSAGIGRTAPSLALAPPKHSHPSSSLTAAKAGGLAPDLELKISTARQSEHQQQVQMGPSLPPPPPPPQRTPFLGTIRVT
jgi:hypothetical protein